MGVTLMFARKLPWAEVWSGLAEASLSLVALALIANYAAFAARTALWQRLLNAIGVTLPGLALRAMIASAALNCILVGNVGDAARVVLVTRRTSARAAMVIASVVFERLTITAGYLAVLAIAGLCLPLPPELDRWRFPAIAGVCLAVLLLALVARGGDAEARAGCIVRRGASMLRSMVRKASGGGGAITIAALTAANWGCQLATFHWAAKAMDLPISVAGSALAMLIVLASGSVRATPANLGVTQVAYATAAELLGLPAGPALAVGVLLQVIQTAPVVVAGLFVLPELATAMRRDASRPMGQDSSVPLHHGRVGRV